jgi:hypothetical protein
MRNVTFCALIGLLLSSCGSDAYDLENPENPRNWVKYGMTPGGYNGIALVDFPVYFDSANVFPKNPKGDFYAVRTASFESNRYDDHIEGEFFAFCSSKEYAVQSRKLYKKDGTTEHLGSPGNKMDATIFYSPGFSNDPAARLYRHLCDGETLGN